MNRKSIKLENILICLYVILKPIYLFSSGTLQIGDIFLLLFVVVCIFKSIPRKQKVVSKDSNSLINLYFIFMLWVIFVNLIYFLYYNNNAFIIYTLYYIFNYMALLGFYLYYNKINNSYQKLNNLLDKSFFISILIEFLFLIANMTSSMRRLYGTFNNPNQLGYYGLLTFTYSILFMKNKKIKVICLFISIIITLLSVSKAAIFGLIAMVFTYILTGMKDIKIVKKIMLILFVIFVSGVIYFNYTKIPMINNFVNRATNLQSDDNLTNGRGYNRITEIGYKIIFGTGEGMHERFVFNHEIHSTYVGILCNYGIIGFILLLFVLKKGINKIPYNKIYSLLGIMIYWITHQGIRNTIFWIILFMICISFGRSKENE